MDNEEVLAKHPRFAGDLDHLLPFATVAASPPVSEERGRALGEWRAFNTVVVAPASARPTVTCDAKLPDGQKPAIMKVASWIAYQGKRGSTSGASTLPSPSSVRSISAALWHRLLGCPVSEFGLYVPCALNPETRE